MLNWQSKYSYTPCSESGIESGKVRFFVFPWLESGDDRNKKTVHTRSKKKSSISMMNFANVEFRREQQRTMKHHEEKNYDFMEISLSWNRKNKKKWHKEHIHDHKACVYE